jgi:hypothetical protein
LAEDGKQTAAKTAKATDRAAHASDKHVDTLLAKIRDLTAEERLTLWSTLVDQWGEEIILALDERLPACSRKRQLA